MSTGTAKWFSPTKGLVSSNLKAAFVHNSAVEKAGLSPHDEGQKMDFEIVSTRGKSSAENVKVK
jgi:cold shock protein